MEIQEELLQIADHLEQQAIKLSDQKFAQPINRLKAAATIVGKSFGGSWLGYHANVYYCDLKPPPPGANFNAEWGLHSGLNSFGTIGEWVQFDPDEIRKYILEKAKKPDLKMIEKLVETLNATFEEGRATFLSIVSAELDERSDRFLDGLKSKIEALSPLSSYKICQQLAPTRQIMTRDSTAAGQGTMTPPHIEMLSKAIAAEHVGEILNALALTAKKVGSHLSRK